MNAHTTVARNCRPAHPRRDDADDDDRDEEQRPRAALGGPATLFDERFEGAARRDDAGHPAPLGAAAASGGHPRPAPPPSTASGSSAWWPTSRPTA